MASKVLTKSTKKLELIILTTGIATIFLMVFSMAMVNLLLTWAVRTEGFLSLLILVGLPLLWLAQSVGMYIAWNQFSATADNSAIKVKRKGKWGASSSTVYRYESIVTVELRQTYFGKKYNYGDIVLTIPKLEYPIILHNIDSPKKSMLLIQEKIANLRANTQSLIN